LSRLALATQSNRALEPFNTAAQISSAGAIIHGIRNSEVLLAHRVNSTIVSRRGMLAPKVLGVGATWI